MSWSESVSFQASVGTKSSVRGCHPPWSPEEGRHWGETGLPIPGLHVFPISVLESPQSVFVSSRRSRVLCEDRDLLVEKLGGAQPVWLRRGRALGDTRGTGTSTWAGHRVDSTVVFGKPHSRIFPMASATSGSMADSSDLS